MSQYGEIVENGLWKQNPGVVQLLGLCPTLAVTSTAINGLSLGIATSLNNLGEVMLELGDRPAARALLEESLAIKRALGDRRGIAISLGNLGTLARLQGDYAAAQTLYEESLALRQELGDRLGIAIMLSHRGLVAYHQGDCAAARALHEKVLASDIDPPSVQVARDNARLNLSGPLVQAIRATGFAAPQFACHAPFDLVLANILANPLRQLAGPMARHLAPSAMVILSGLLTHQAPAVIAAYRARGLVLLRHLRIEGWSSLLLRKVN